MDTAFEGGINYWCAGAHHLLDDDNKVVGWKIMPDRDKAVSVDYDQIRAAVRQLANGEVQVNDQIRQWIRDSIGDQDNIGCYIDADAADVIVQVACFGEIVYG
jgi:hypothetical protein